MTTKDPKKGEPPQQPAAKPAAPPPPEPIPAGPKPKPQPKPAKLTWYALCALRAALKGGTLPVDTADSVAVELDRLGMIDVENRLTFEGAQRARQDDVQTIHPCHRCGHMMQTDLLMPLEPPTCGPCSKSIRTEVDQEGLERQARGPWANRDPQT